VGCLVDKDYIVAAVKQRMILPQINSQTDFGNSVGDHLIGHVWASVCMKAADSRSSFIALCRLPRQPNPHSGLPQEQLLLPLHHTHDVTATFTQHFAESLQAFRVNQHTYGKAWLILMGAFSETAVQFQGAGIFKQGTQRLGTPNRTQGSLPGVSITQGLEGNMSKERAVGVCLPRQS
jgi:hypothetical protein